MVFIETKTLSENSAFAFQYRVTGKAGRKLADVHVRVHEVNNFGKAQLTQQKGDKACLGELSDRSDSPTSDAEDLRFTSRIFQGGPEMIPSCSTSFLS